MFGKLLKYDFRAMWKQFAFIWPAALVLALVNRFTVNSFVASANNVRQTVSGVALLIYVAILIAMFVIAVIFVIQRFFRGLLGDEGYLMHTLPVKPWQLIGSKLLTAVVTTAISVAVAILSIFLVVPVGVEDFQELFRGLRYIFSHWDLQITNIVIALLEAVLFILVCFATGYLQLYLAMALGHLFNKNRVAASVIALVAISTLISALGNLILPTVGEWISPLLNNMQSISSYHIAIWIAIAQELVLCAVYFAGTEYILRKRLNLE